MQTSDQRTTVRSCKGLDQGETDTMWWRGRLSRGSGDKPGVVRIRAMIIVVMVVMPVVDVVFACDASY